MLAAPARQHVRKFAKSATCRYRGYSWRILTFHHSSATFSPLAVHQLHQRACSQYSDALDGQIIISPFHRTIGIIQRLPLPANFPAFSQRLPDHLVTAPRNSSGLKIIVRSPSRLHRYAEHLHSFSLVSIFLARPCCSDFISGGHNQRAISAPPMETTTAFQTATLSRLGGLRAVFEQEWHCFVFGAQSIYRRSAPSAKTWIVLRYHLPCRLRRCAASGQHHHLPLTRLFH